MADFWLKYDPIQLQMRADTDGFGFQAQEAIRDEKMRRFQDLSLSHYQEEQDRPKQRELDRKWLEEINKQQELDRKWREEMNKRQEANR